MQKAFETTVISLWVSECVRIQIPVRYIPVSWLTKLPLSINIKRVYAAPDRVDGYRILVDRIWPRGIRKENAHIDEWWKEYAPSNELRIWFGHDPNRWLSFQKKYLTELQSNHENIANAVIRTGSDKITLIYGSRDTRHNQAVVLKNYIELEVLNNSEP